MTDGINGGALVANIGLLCIVAAIWLSWGDAAGLVSMGVFLVMTGAAQQVDEDE